MSYEYEFSDEKDSKQQNLKEMVKLIEEDIFVNSEEAVRFNYLETLNLWSVKLAGYIFLTVFVSCFLLFSFFGWGMWAKIILGVIASFFGTLGAFGLLDENEVLRFFMYEKSIKRMLNKFGNADEFVSFMAISMRNRYVSENSDENKKDIKQVIGSVYDGVRDYYQTGKISSSAKFGLVMFMIGLSKDVTDIKKNTLRNEKFNSFIEEGGEVLQKATSNYLQSKEKTKDEEISRNSLMNMERKND